MCEVREGTETAMAQGLGECTMKPRHEIAEIVIVHLVWWAIGAMLILASG